MESWTTAKKTFKLMFRCHQLLSGFLPKGHLRRVSDQSRLSAKDKGDNEIILDRFVGLVVNMSDY